MNLQYHIETLAADDPQPRRGFQPGDVVRISVDCHGLCGRDPHPPVKRRTKGGKSYGIPYSPVKLGVVAFYDKEGTDFEWENCAAGHANGDYEGYLPPNYYYVASDHGYFVFADYELELTKLGNLGSLPEPYCIAEGPCAP